MNGLALLLLTELVSAQKFGSNVPEEHPPLKVHECTSTACEPKDRAAVIDANWRWVHDVKGYTNCYTGNDWSKALCPDIETCAANCALEGIDEKSYASNYGVTSTGSELTLDFVVPGGNVGSRMYLMEDEHTYQMFHLKNKEFAFDVDVSKLGCGINGALYFVQMDADGGKALYKGNEAGAKYGTGYCDAQCPHDGKFINGEPNLLDWNGTSTGGFGRYGSCCVEMDLWEANAMATAFTGHSCGVKRQTRCDGVECGDNGKGDRYKGTCDADGCDVNTYRNGNETFYGEGAAFAVDTTRPFTVVTQFLTDDGTDDGKLVEVRRHYVQDDVRIETPASRVGEKAYNSISDGYCAAEKDAFNSSATFLERGGLSSLDDAFSKGMVLVLSIWDDYASHMLWLDSNDPPNSTDPGAKRGPCDVKSGDPKVIRPGSKAAVSYGNIKWGEIGSTDKAFPPSPPAPPPSPPPPSPPYVHFPDSNCYNGHGGREIDAGAAPFSVTECEARCDADDACGCVTYQPSSRTCYKRASCVPADFVGGAGYDVYVKKGAARTVVEAAEPASDPIAPAVRAAAAKAHFEYSRAAASFGVSRAAPGA